MKNLFTGTLVILLIVMLASCERKEYTCTCVLNTGGVYSKQAFDMGKMSWNTAQDKCNDKQKSLNNPVYGVTAQCKTE